MKMPSEFPRFRIINPKYGSFFAQEEKENGKWEDLPNPMSTFGTTYHSSEWTAENTIRLRKASIKRDKEIKEFVPPPPKYY